MRTHAHLLAPLFLAGVSAGAAPPAQEVAAPTEPLLGAFVTEIGGLREPAALAVDEDGTLWIAEAAADRIAAVRRDGSRLVAFGAPGSGEGELREPSGIALASGGLVVVSDAGNHRVQVFRRDGTFVRSFGSFGSGAGELNSPRGLAVSGERVYVADSRNDRVAVFDLEGRPLAPLAPAGAEALEGPVDVAVDGEGGEGGEGLAFVCDRDRHRVVVLDAAGEVKAAWGEHGPHPGFFAAPSALAAGGGRVFVADRDNHRIQAFTRGGEPLYEWGLHAILPRESGGKLHYPDGVALAPGGAFAAVAERFEDRVQLFGPSEGPPPSTDPATLTGPSAHYGPPIAVAGDLMALVEPSVPAVLLYDLFPGFDTPEPIHVTQITLAGRKPGELARPSDVAIDFERRLLWVSDPANRRLSSFRIQREEAEAVRFDPRMLQFARALDLAALGPPPGAEQPIEPGALELAPGGRILLADLANRALATLAPDLSLEAWWPLAPLGVVEPTDIALSPTGERTYVLDRLGQRVHVLDREGAELAAWGEIGEGQGGLVRPSGIAAADGRLYVTDAALHRIQIFDEEGRSLATWGSQGLGPRELFKPGGVAIDREGRIIVVDHGNHRGQVLTPRGEFITAFGSRFFTLPALR